MPFSERGIPEEFAKGSEQEKRRRLLNQINDIINTQVFSEEATDDLKTTEQKIKEILEDQGKTNLKWPIVRLFHELKERFPKGDWEWGPVKGEEDEPWDETHIPPSDEEVEEYFNSRKEPFLEEVAEVILTNDYEKSPRSEAVTDTEHIIDKLQSTPEGTEPDFDGAKKELLDRLSQNTWQFKRIMNRAQKIIDELKKECDDRKKDIENESEGTWANVNKKYYEEHPVPNYTRAKSELAKLIKESNATYTWEDGFYEQTEKK
jgi:hypothetical protein